MIQQFKTTKTCPNANLGLALFALCFMISALRAESPTGQSAAGSVRTLYPPEGSVVLQEAVRFIAIGKPGEPVPKATCDGQPLKLDTMEFAPSWLPKGVKSSIVISSQTNAPNSWLKDKAGKGILYTTLMLSPGQHMVDIGGVKTRLFRSTQAEGKDGPTGWTLFRPHPGVTDTNQPIDCISCHDVKTSATVSQLERVKMPETCQNCHDAVDLRLTHSHVMEPLSNCTLCHDPHGSSRPSLLINTKEKLCTQCHEGGHTRS